MNAAAEPKHNFLALFIIIPISLFAIFGFKNISQQGILFHDVGMNLLEAEFVGEGVRLAPNLSNTANSTNGLWVELKTQTKGVPLHSGKPGDSLILWLASLFFGFHDTLSAEVSVVCDLLGLILVFFLILRWNGIREAVYTVTILAASSLYFTLTRSAFADSVTLFFFLIGLLIYPHESNFHSPTAPNHKATLQSLNRLFLTGFFFGLAFACTQWRIAYILGVLLLFECFRQLKVGLSWNPLFFRTFLILLGFLTPIVVFQIPYLALEYRFGPLPFTDYWAQLHERLTHGLGLKWFQNPTELFKTYWIAESPIFPILTIAGWIYLTTAWIKRRNINDLFPLIFSIIPYLYFSAAMYQNVFLPRTTLLAIPMAAACAGIGLSQFQSYAEKKWPVSFRSSILFSFFIVSSITAQGAWHQWHRGGITRSGYADASRYLASTKDSQFFLLSNEPIWRFYLGRVAYHPYQRPQNLPDLLRIGKIAGINRVVVDYSTLYSKYGMTYTQKLLGALAPERFFKNPRGCNLLYLLDEFGLEKSLEISKDPRTCDIYVYHLSDIQKALADGKLS